MSGEPRFQVSVRDRTGREVEGVSAYVSLGLTLRLRDVGQWALTLPPGHHATALLMVDGAGIVVRRAGRGDVVCSGEVATVVVVEGDGDPSQDGVVVMGATDEAVLSGDLAYPDPSLPVPIGALGTMGTARDVFTGPAEDALVHYVGANIGQDAAQVLRRRIVVPASLGRGRVRTWGERFSTLLDVAQRVGSVSSLAWRVAQHPTEPYQRLEVFTQKERSEARFSRESGTLSRVEVEKTTPDVTDVIVAGGGVGTQRLLTRVTAPGDQTVPFFPILPVTLSNGEQSRLHRARTKWVDQSSGESLDELALVGAEELAQVASPLVVRVTVVEQDWLRWGVHYHVGDVVTVSTGLPQRGGITVQDVVTAVEVVDDENGMTVTPTVGFEGSAATGEPVARAVARQVAQIVRE